MREDFILDDDGDFPLEDTVINGQVLPTPYGGSDSQHIEDLIFNMPGDLKYSPLDGMYVLKYINSESSTQLVERNLNIMLDRDGYKSRNGVVYPTKDSFEISDEYISNK